MRLILRTTLHRLGRPAWLTLINAVDPEVICGISSEAEHWPTGDDYCQHSNNELKVLDLRWSGSNAVLRAWSEPEGLPLLRNLETVNIIIPDKLIVSGHIHNSDC